MSRLHPTARLAWMWMWIWLVPALAEVVKTGSTCVVTPLGDGARKSIGTVSPDERDFNPDDPETYQAPPLGAPGALGVYPRPEPSRGSKPPMEPLGGWDMYPYQRPDEGGRLRGGSGDFDNDAYQILDAFKQCGRDGEVIFREGTYNIRSVMNTTALQNCSVEIHGRFVWSVDNIQYWMARGHSVGYAGRSTVWLLGGKDVRVRGFGKAVFDASGQVWVGQNRRLSGRTGWPISLTVWQGTNILIDGISWRRPIFGGVFVALSRNVTTRNLNMNMTSCSTWQAAGSEGVGTWNSRDVAIQNLTVNCSDACVGVKGNSTNVHVNDVTCYGSGVGIGSVGQDSNSPDYVENVVFEDIRSFNSINAGWIKTQSGDGRVRNITFRKIHLDGVNQPIYVTSCPDAGSDCDSSRVGIVDVSWESITGTSQYNVAAAIHCSQRAPCDKFRFSNLDIKPLKGGTVRNLCSNINNEAASGLECVAPCPGSHPQQLLGNV